MIPGDSIFKQRKECSLTVLILGLNLHKIKIKEDQEGIEIE